MTNKENPLKGWLLANSLRIAPVATSTVLWPESHLETWTPSFMLTASGHPFFLQGSWCEDLKSPRQNGRQPEPISTQVKPPPVQLGT